MPTPLAKYWAPIVQRPWGEGADYPWRDASVNPPPAPPTEVFWLEQPAGMPDFEFQRRVSMGAEPSFRGAQKP